MSVCSIEGCGKQVIAKGWCPAHYAKARKYGDPLTVKQEQMHGATLADRLMAKCNKTETCWEWTGSLNNKGYGQINVGNYPYLVHRVSYETFRGPIPEGMGVLHRCDNPRCLRPEHLFLGDQQMNMADKMAKKRHRYGVSQGEDHGCAKLTDNQVRAIRQSGQSRSTLAQKYGVSLTTIGEIQTLKTWKHLL